MQEISTPLVSEIMQKPVHTLSPGDKLREAAGIMSKENVGSVVIVENEMPVGIVTEKDLIKALDEGSDKLEQPIRDAMSCPVTTIVTDEHPTVGLMMMAKKAITHLAVVHKEGKIVGIISQKDLVVWFMKHPAAMLGF